MSTLYRRKVKITTNEVIRTCVNRNSDQIFDFKVYFIK